MNIGNDVKKKEYYSIGEVASITDVKQTVLRFWESEFENLNPKKNKFGHRVYTEKDIKIIKIIKDLLYEKGLTIKGAKNFLTKSTKLTNANEIKSKLLEILSLLKTGQTKDNHEKK